MTHSAQERNILRTPGRVSKRTQEVVREAQVKVIPGLDLRNILRRELQAEGFDVGLEMLDLAAADDGEEIGGLHHVSHHSLTGMRREY